MSIEQNAKRQQVLIFGPFGTDNIGAEWALEILLTYLRQQGYATVVAALDAARTTAQHHVPSIPLDDLSALEKVLCESNMAIWLGGELPDLPPTAITPMSDLLIGKTQPELTVCHLAELYKIPAMALNLCLRLSPLGMQSQSGLQQVLRGLRFISVCDQVSADILTDLLGPDVALARADLRFYGLPASSFSIATPSSEARLVIFWKDDVISPATTAQACAKWLVSNPVATAVVAQMNSFTDSAALSAAFQDIPRLEIIQTGLSPRQLLNLTKNATAVLAMGSNALIAAWLAQQPVAIIAADNDMRDMLARGHYEKSVPTPGEATPDVILRAIETAVPLPDAFRVEEKTRANELLAFVAKLCADDRLGIDANLRPAGSSPAQLWRMLPPDTDATRLHRTLRAAEARLEIARDRADKAEARAEKAEAELAQTKTQLLERSNELLEKHHLLATTQWELQAMKQSFAWRLGSKVTAVAAAMRRLFRRNPPPPST
jgi:hypothetical protein